MAGVDADSGESVCEEPGGVCDSSPLVEAGIGRSKRRTAGKGAETIGSKTNWIDADMTIEDSKPKIVNGVKLGEVSIYWSSLLCFR